MCTNGVRFMRISHLIAIGLWCGICVAGEEGILTATIERSDGQPVLEGDFGIISPHTLKRIKSVRVSQGAIKVTLSEGSYLIECCRNEPSAYGLAQRIVELTPRGAHIRIKLNGLPIDQVIGEGPSPSWVIKGTVDSSWNIRNPWVRACHVGASVCFDAQLNRSGEFTIPVGRLGSYQVVLYDEDETVGVGDVLIERDSVAFVRSRLTRVRGSAKR